MKNKEKKSDNSERFFNKLTEGQKLFAYTTAVICSTVSIITYFNAKEKNINTKHKEEIRVIVQEELKNVNSTISTGFKEQSKQIDSLKIAFDKQCDQTGALQKNFVLYVRENTSQVSSLYRYLQGLDLSEKKNQNEAKLDLIFVNTKQ